MKPGDFSKLAIDYQKYRPSYNKEVVKAILRSTTKAPETIVAADIGAGTGIFTKCLIDAGIKKAVAIEPNDDMRNIGSEILGGKINFLNGSGENTTLASNTYDLVTMASSFHWTDTKDTLAEFDRILTKNGMFAALWNPRLTDRSVGETRVENILSEKYNIRSRISSGLSGITDNLREVIIDSGHFRSVMYIDAIDVVRRSHEQYIGAWRSVNDVQVQLGKHKFRSFLNDIQIATENLPHIEVHYLTRAWLAFKNR